MSSPPPGSTLPPRVPFHPSAREAPPASSHRERPRPSARLLLPAASSACRSPPPLPSCSARPFAVNHCRRPLPCTERARTRLTLPPPLNVRPRRARASSNLRQRVRCCIQAVGPLAIFPPPAVNDGSGGHQVLESMPTWDMFMQCRAHRGPICPDIKFDVHVLPKPIPLLPVTRASTNLQGATGRPATSKPQGRHHGTWW